MKIEIRPDKVNDPTWIDYRSIEFSNTETTNTLIDCIRELLQNSWDAFNGGNENKGVKFKFKITLDKLDKNILPFDVYEEYLHKSNEHYNMLINRDRSDIDKEYKKINHFFLKIIKGEMYYLNIEDNSGGLEGTTRYTNQKLGSKALVQSDMSVKPNINNSMGTYGKGKYTSIIHSPIRTVFYINQRRDKKYFIGKSEINPYSFEDTETGLDKFKGKEFYWGKSNLEDQCDWIELDETNKKIKNLRNFNSDGLSTIIPIILNNEKSDWKEQCAYSIISSFFKIIEDDRVEIQIEDRTQLKNNYYTINNHDDIKTTIKDLKKSNFIRTNNNVGEEFNKIESFVLDRNPKVYKESFKLIVDGKKRNYEIDLKLFKAGKTESGIKKDYFSFVRDGMLLRKEDMLSGGLPYSNNLKFYGYVSTPSKELNKILSQFEPPSHDQIVPKIHSKLPDKLPDSWHLTRFLGEIRKWTFKKLKENCFDSSNTNQKTTWLFEGQNNKGNENQTDQPVYSRNYRLKKDDFKIINPKTISLLTEGEVLFLNKDGDLTTHKLDPKGDYVEYVRRKPKIRPPRPPVPPPDDPPVEKRKVNRKKIDKPAIEKTGKVHPKNFQSKITKKENNITNYTISIDDVDFSNINKFRIKQESISTTKAVSFKVKKAFFNGHRINSILVVKSGTNQSLVSGYDLKIEQIHKIEKTESILKLELEELYSTFSTFEISIHK
jgi:hypothetical protein